MHLTRGRFDRTACAGLSGTFRTAGLRNIKEYDVCLCSTLSPTKNIGT